MGKIFTRRSMGIAAVLLALSIQPAWSGAITVNSSSHPGYLTFSGFTLDASPGVLTTGDSSMTAGGVATAGTVSSTTPTIAAQSAAGLAFFDGGAYDDNSFTTTAMASSFGDTATAFSSFEFKLPFTLSLPSLVTYQFDYDAAFSEIVGNGIFGRSTFRFGIFGRNSAHENIQTTFDFTRTLPEGDTYGTNTLKLEDVIDGYVYAYNESYASAVPEPGTFLLAGCGFLGIFILRRKLPKAA